MGHTTFPQKMGVPATCVVPMCACPSPAWWSRNRPSIWGTALLAQQHRLRAGDNLPTSSAECSAPRSLSAAPSRHLQALSAKCLLEKYL